MRVTALIQNNTLIIPNVDVSHLQALADKNGLIEFDLPILDTVKSTVKPKKTIQELAGGLAHKTTVVATIEEMNESIAEVYANREV